MKLRKVGTSPGRSVGSWKSSGRALGAGGVGTGCGGQPGAGAAGRAAAAARRGADGRTGRGVGVGDAGTGPRRLDLGSGVAGWGYLTGASGRPSTPHWALAAAAVCGTAGREGIAGERTGGGRVGGEKTAVARVPVDSSHMIFFSPAARSIPFIFFSRAIVFGP